jgi:hypothetical protein
VHKPCAISGQGLGHFGGEHLQHCNVSGFQGKNLSTQEACQTEVVNLSIAFGPRQNAQAPALKWRKA